MATNFLRGVNFPIAEEIEIEFDPTRGLTTITSSSSINGASMIALANQYQIAGIAYKFTQRGGVNRIVANDATGNNPIDNWELSGDAERKDLFQNPRWASVISAAQIAAIRTHLENNDNQATAFADPVLAPLNNGVVFRAYARYQAGNDEFENDAFGGGFVLRHTGNFPSRYFSNLGTSVMSANIGVIYTTGNLLSEAMNANLWTFPLPLALQVAVNAAGVAAVNAVPINSDSFALNGSGFYAVGWKKSRPTIRTVANNRVDIVQNYTLELWNTDDYST